MGANGKAKEQALLSEAKSAFDGLMNTNETLQAASNRVAQEFNPLTDGFHPHEARLEFAEATLLGLARDLRFRLSQQGVDLAELAETGLGYANLLYLASVLVELAAAKDAELTLLLVEEPEAHLHPQLQAVTLALLRKRAHESHQRVVGRGERAGRIQVIVTTHSPNLASSVPCDHIVVMRSRSRSLSKLVATGENDRQFPTPTEAEISTDARTPLAGSTRQDGSPKEPQPHSPSSQSVAVSRLGIKPWLLRKVDRYLDVTRSGMLFSRRILLVEGLAEALLMPVFARQIFESGSADLNRFHSVSVVAIDGVDFEPFVRLLLCPEETGGSTIAELVVAVTDDDAATEEEEDGDGDSDVENRENEEANADNADNAKAGATREGGQPSQVRASSSAGERRKKGLEAIAEEYGVRDRLSVMVTSVTFEHALVEHCADDPDRIALIESACANMNKTPGWVVRRRERFQEKVLKKTTAAERARAFMDEFVNRKFRKGDFAQLLAAEIEPADGRPQKSFGVPHPFENALRRIVKVP